MWIFFLEDTWETYQAKTKQFISAEIIILYLTFVKYDSYIFAVHTYIICMVLHAALEQAWQLLHEYKDHDYRIMTALVIYDPFPCDPWEKAVWSLRMWTFLRSSSALMKINSFVCFYFFQASIVPWALPTLSPVQLEPFVIRQGWMPHLGPAMLDITAPQAPNTRTPHFAHPDTTAPLERLHLFPALLEPYRVR